MQERPESHPKLKFAHHPKLPGWAHGLASIGGETEAVVLPYFEGQGSFADVFTTYDETALSEFANALRTWSDADAAKLVREIFSTAERGARVDFRALARWVLLQKDDWEAVLDCMNTEPPSEVEILKVLSKAGSQKVVFLATWRLTQQRVVLKKLAGPAHESVLSREISSHPLSVSHPTIIKTNFLQNSNHETFLAERWLPEVLHDHWKCEGVQQAANLLYCLADAVTVVHSMGLVHGDIKPDNIGKDEDLFILLDFGICRPATDFTHEVTATGSLRTRAPELLLSDKYEGDAKKIDIWAIGATLFNFLVGRFPLIDRDEAIPRISAPVEREAFQVELQRRADQEWEKRVAVGQLPEVMRPILEKCLDKEPTRRPSAADLKTMVENGLPVFLRQDFEAERFSPIDELGQLTDFLPSSDVLTLMPADEKTKLKKRLENLRAKSGFDTEQRSQLEEIEKRLNA